MYLGRSSIQIERDFGQRLSRLRREGFEVHVLAGDDGGFAALEGRGLICKPLPVGRKLNVAGLLGAYFIVQAYFIEQRPALVHSFDDVLAWMGAVCARRAEVPAIFATVERHAFVSDPVRLELDTILPVPPSLLEAVEALTNNLGGEAVRKGLIRAYALLGEWVDKYLVINEHDFQALQDLSLVEPQKLEMILGGNGVDLEDFDIDDDDFPSVAQARQSLGLPERWRQVLGYVGRLTLPRGASDLLDCIEQVAQTHPAAGWLIGVEEDVSPVQLERLERFQERGQVEIVREPIDTALVMRALDLFVLPSYREGSPAHLMEAGACGVGAIAYNLPATQTVIEHGQTGELVTRGDVDALAHAVRNALDDPRRIETYGVRARGRAVRKFNRQYVEDQVFRLYDTVLEMKRQESGKAGV
jgi:glycosyltransferase involved in cell wall biosynthesis